MNFKFASHDGAGQSFAQKQQPHLKSGNDMNKEDRYDMFADLCSLPSEPTWVGPMADPTRVAYRDRLVHWTLCIYVGVGGMPGYTDEGKPRQNSMATFLGVPQLANPDCNSQQVHAALLKALEAEEAKLGCGSLVPPVAPCSMRNNIEWLANTVGLKPVEQDILELLTAIAVFNNIKIQNHSPLPPARIIVAERSR
jgi:hypothetical protein